MKIEADILLADDEEKILDLVEEMLLKEGFHHTRKICNGADTLRICRELHPHAIILNIMFPNMNGLGVCKEIREFSYYSILLLSSGNGDVDKILGLSCNSNDCITKPFSPREVVFRIKVQFRCQQYQTSLPSGHDTRLTTGLLTIDRESCRVWENKREIELTGREFLPLAYLIEHGNHIINRERLYEQVQGEHNSICDNAIMVHIRHLWGEIEDSPSHPQQFIAVKGLGYRPKKGIDQMKRSGYRTISHTYLLLFLSLSGAVLLARYLFFLIVIIEVPDDQILRSDWPQTYTEHFQEQVLFTGGTPRLIQVGTAKLQDYGIGIQMLDTPGYEMYSYQKSEYGSTVYSSAELLRLYETGRMGDNGITALVGNVSNQGNSYAYVLYFPEHVSKVTMYINRERFSGGRMVILPVLTALLLLILAAGALYGLFATNAIKRLATSMEEITHRRYLPIQDHGMFHDLYGGLNTLDEEIQASDRPQTQTEKIQEEWVANIIRDLKTSLSPIRGYKEVLYEADGRSRGECRHYGGILLKNVSYTETLTGSLKLTYQLDGGMFPLHRKGGNLIRFLGELVIGILNMPEYKNRVIYFESEAGSLSFSFDRTLFTETSHNLAINASAHREEHAGVTLHVFADDERLGILVADDDASMKSETVEHLLRRYYRDADAEQKPEGTSLGLAVVKGIMKLYGGSISVTSTPTTGTSFRIIFPLR